MATEYIALGKRGIIVKEFVFKLPTRIVFGQGASTRLGPLCREFGAEKVMVVTDRVIGASQGFQGILKGLEEDGIDYQSMTRLCPNAGRDCGCGGGLSEKDWLRHGDRSRGR